MSSSGLPTIHYTCRQILMAICKLVSFLLPTFHPSFPSSFTIPLLPSLIFLFSPIPLPPYLPLPLPIPRFLYLPVPISEERIYWKKLQKLQPCSSHQHTKFNYAIAVYSYIYFVNHQLPSNMPSYDVQPLQWMIILTIACTMSSLNFTST